MSSLRAMTLTLLASLAMAADPLVLPQLDAAAAQRHRVPDYLAQGGQPWQPEALSDAAKWQADFIVAADGSGTHRTLAAAIAALPAKGSTTKRSYIQLKAGHYRELLCLKDKAPVTLYGDPADAAAVTIVEGRYNALAKQTGEPANPCLPDLPATIWGTAGSASFAVFSDDVQLAHLTIANDAMDAVRNGEGYPAGVGESGGAQAVALMTEGDRIQLDNVRLIGHQDTLYVRHPKGSVAGRVHVRNSLIAGDVDFIFGDATLVIEQSQIISRAGRRKPGHGGHVFAPSTAPDRSLGMLISQTRFFAEPGVTVGSISLGRAWDHGVAKGAWQAGVSPNGQVLVRDSVLGPHIGAWGTSTSRRPFSAEGPQANRFAEYANVRLPALAPAGQRDIAREVLGLRDGWAAADGGTRGGADALPADVHDVRTRTELLAALTPHPRPRIVRVHGLINLSADDTGRVLTAADFRDPDHDEAAFDRAYAPAVWGVNKPAGPLEEARKRSAKRQSDFVTVRIPSNTTLIGVGKDAGLTRGMVLVQKVDNVILRNLTISDAFDHFPAWDPADGIGEWNSEYDSVSVRTARYVWIDHCTLSSAPGDTPPRPLRLGRPMQHYDGLLDVIQQSNHVTISWNHFRNHEKTSLVGSSDKQELDRGLLKISYHHNRWDNVKERAPRVRYGQVHLYNNLHETRDSGAYAWNYSIGVGREAQIISERNVWEGPASLSAGRVFKLLGGQAFRDQGSWFNGKPLVLETADLQPQGISWMPLWVQGLDVVEGLAAQIRAGAGAGQLE